MTSKARRRGAAAKGAFAWRDLRHVQAEGEDVMTVKSMREVPVRRVILDADRARPAAGGDRNGQGMAAFAGCLRPAGCGP